MVVLRQRVVAPTAEQEAPGSGVVHQAAVEWPQIQTDPVLLVDLLPLHAPVWQVEASSGFLHGTAAGLAFQPANCTEGRISYRGWHLFIAYLEETYLHHIKQHMIVSVLSERAYASW